MLAIIIPYYKLTFFRETLMSLAAQTNQRFTVYIGDDASPENLQNLLKEFQGIFDYVYKRFPKNLGGLSLTQQWERCIEMSVYEEWFMVLGDDDMLSEKVVAKFYENLSLINQSSHIVRFSSQVIDEAGKPVAKRYFQPQYEDAIHSYYRKFKGENRGSLSEFIFRRSRHEKFKFKDYPLGWTADDRAIIDFSQGKMIYSINDAVVFFRKSASHISSRVDNMELKSQAHLESMKDLIADYKHAMDKEKLTFFIRVYENQILSFNKVEFKYYRDLFYLYLWYRNRKEVWVLLKSVIAKFFKW